MRSEASWQRQEQALKSAKVLAEFTNLDDASAAEDFIRKHRDFVPPLWWTGRAWKEGVGKYTPWMRERDLLRKAWSAGFPADTTLELATNNLFLAAHALASNTTTEMKTAPQKIWSYQRAVLFLHVNPTRARICEWCGRRFISETNARFCRFGGVVDVDGDETTCFWAHRKQYRKDNWSENSDSINKRRKREYRLEKKRSHRAKRKNIRQR